MATKKILISIEVGAKDANVTVDKVTKSLKGLTDAQVKVREETDRGRAQAGLNNAILLETGRLASDASFGFQGMANNLGQLATLFGSFVKTNKSVTKSIRQLLNSLIGTGGFLIAVQLIIAFGDKIFAFFRELAFGVDATKEAFDKLGESASSTSAAFNIYISRLQDANTSQEEQEAVIKKLNEEFPEFVQNLQESGVSMEDIRNKTRDANLQIQQQRQEIIKLAKSRAAMNRIEEITGEIIDERIKGDEKAREEGFKTFEAARERFEFLDKIPEREGRRRTVEERVERANLLQIGRIDKRIKKREEEINVLEKFVDFSLGPLQEANETESKYQKSRIGNVESEIRSLREIGAMRRKFFKQNQDFDVEQARSERDRIELERAQRLAELDAIVASEGLKLQARFEINKFYNNLIIKDEERVAEVRKKLQLDVLSFYAKAVGSLGELFGKQTAAGKAAAIAEIAINTGIGFVQALDIAQKSAKGTGPAAAFAFPIFYASQIAAVLGAAAQAKQILNSGGRTSGSSPSAASPTTSIDAPDFNVVGASETSQLATSLAGVTGRPIQAFVVGKEVTTQQELDRNITNNASIN